MNSQKKNQLSTLQEASIEPTRPGEHRRPVTKVTQARAKAQRTKIDRQEEQRRQQQEALHEGDEKGEKPSSQTVQARRRAKMTVERAIGDYLDDHVGGNHSDKTL